MAKRKSSVTRKRTAPKRKIKAEKQSSGPGWVLYGIMGGVVLGILMGGLAPELAGKTAFLGELFMNALMMLVVPLVMVSMIVGITRLGDVRELGSLGSRTVIYYMVTTGFSVLVGILLVNLIQPGKGITRGETHAQAEYQIKGQELFMKNVSFTKTDFDSRYVIVLQDQDIQGAIEAIHGNQGLVADWRNMDGEPALPKLWGRGVSISLPIVDRVRGKDKGIMEVLTDMLVGLVPRNLFKAMVETKILPLIVFSLIFGAVLSTLGSKGKVAVDFFEAANEAIMGIVGLVMKVAPFGIFGLVAARIGRAGGFEGFLPELAALGKYFSTVVLGLGIHAFITLALILYFLGGRKPWQYAKNMGSALLNAFSTASSTATLPLTIQCMKEKNNVSSRVAGFVLPLGATINMDGTALYEAVAAIFIAQVYGIELSFFQMVLIFLTATLAAVGAAGIPEAGLVTMVIVLRAVDLPVEGIALILTIDWFLDRFRTTVNVWGDGVIAAVIDRREGEDKPQARSSGRRR